MKNHIDLDYVSSLGVSTSSFPNSVEDHKWLLGISKKIDSSCQDIFEWFFNVNGVRYDEMPDYMCIPMQCEILHNYRLRYMVIIDELGIPFLCILKLIDPINIQTKPHFVLAYRPLPAKPGADDTNILKSLLRVGVDKTIIVSDENPFNWNFYNTRDDALKMMTSKWRSKHGINKIKNLITISETTSEYRDGIKNLLLQWEKFKGHGGTRNHIKCSELNASDILHHRVYVMDGIVVGYSAIAMFCGNPFVMISKHAGQCNIIDDKFILDHIGDYMIYDMHKMMLEDKNACALYYFGANRGKNKTKNTLEQYKRKVFARSVPYSYKCI